MRGKYTLLWMAVGLAVLVIAAFPAVLDRTSRYLHIYYSPSTLFLAAIGFLLLVCIYFSYELSRLEERTRILAEELAIVRGERDEEAAAARLRSRGRPRARRAIPARGHHSGGCTVAVSRPLRASTHDTTEFEFHISPVSSSSRPHTGVGIVGRSSRILGALERSAVSLTGLPIAASMSGIRPSRQRRIS